MSDQRIREASEELLKLTEYVKQFPDGTMLTWARVEQETGVAMDEPGKAKLRRAIKRAGWPGHKPDIGTGIQLASAPTSIPETVRRQAKVGRAAHRARRFGSESLTRYKEQMSEDDQKALVQKVAVTGAIASAIRQSIMDTKKAEAARQEREQRAQELEEIAKKARKATLGGLSDLASIR